MTMQTVAFGLMCVGGLLGLSSGVGMVSYLYERGQVACPFGSLRGPLAICLLYIRAARGEGRPPGLLVYGLAVGYALALAGGVCLVAATTGGSVALKAVACVSLGGSGLLGLYSGLGMVWYLCDQDEAGVPWGSLRWPLALELLYIRATRAETGRTGVLIYAAAAACVLGIVAGACLLAITTATAPLR